MNDVIFKAPTEDEIARAPLHPALGVPTHVPMESARRGEHVALLNIAAYMRGSRDPWLRYSVVCGGRVAHLATATVRAAVVDGLSTTAFAALDRALSEMPDDPHGPGADEARARAGAAAGAIADTMVRARLLDAVDGWSGVLGDLLDSDPVHGDLHECAISDRALVNVVTCPSTGRRYAHLVPHELDGNPVQTAKQAREWSMGGPMRGIET